MKNTDNTPSPIPCPYCFELHTPIYHDNEPCHECVEVMVENRKARFCRFDRFGGAHTKTQEWLADMAIDYANNYLTAAVFAEHHGIPEQLAKEIIKEGRAINDGLACLY